MNQKITKIVLLIAICLMAPVCFVVYQRNAEKYRYQTDWDIVSVEVKQVDKTCEGANIFSEDELDETYRKKYMYEVDLDIKNYGSEELSIFDVLSIQIRDGEDEYVYSRLEDHYDDLRNNNSLYCEAVPTGRTVTVRFYVLFDEDDSFDSIHIHKDYDDDSYISTELPVPVDM